MNWSKECNVCPLCKVPFLRITKHQNGDNIDYALIKNWEDEDTNLQNPNIDNLNSKKIFSKN